MTERHPLETAVAERINGIIKQEYLEHYQINTIQEAKAVLQNAVSLYNSQRPHMSIGNLTANQIHYSLSPTKPQKLWQNDYTKPTTFVTLIQD